MFLLQRGEVPPTEWRASCVVGHQPGCVFPLCVHGH